VAENVRLAPKADIQLEHPAAD